jgi:hypothetical protein
MASLTYCIPVSGGKVSPVNVLITAKEKFSVVGSGDQSSRGMSLNCKIKLLP